MRTARTAIALLLLTAPHLPAQDSTTAHTPQWMVGASVGLLGGGREVAPELFTVGVHFTQLQRGRLGADISVGTIPRTLAEGLLVGAARLGAVLPLTFAPGVLLLPTAGITLAGVGSLGGAGGEYGYNAGGAAVFGTGPLAFRTGITWNKLASFRSSFWLLEIGFVRIPTTTPID